MTQMFRPKLCLRFQNGGSELMNIVMETAALIYQMYIYIPNIARNPEILTSLEKKRIKIRALILVLQSHRHSGFKL